MSAARTAGRGLAILSIVLANVLGGVAYPVQKLALEGLPPATVGFLRNAVALLPLYLVLRARRRAGAERPRWTGAEKVRVLLLGTVAYALPMWLGIVGVELASAANASILILLEPVTIVAIAWLVLGERVGPLKVLGLVLGLMGALAIVSEGASLRALWAGEAFLGNLLLALHGILWGCHTPLALPLSRRHDAFDLCLRATLLSLLVLGPAALLEAAAWSAGPTLLPALGWTLGLGLFVSFGATVLWLAALRHLQAATVAGFIFLQPLSGVLVGILFLGERLSPAALTGGTLIVVGVALDVLRTNRRAPQAVAGS
ncbi:MAG TPA: DMT family transporter [Planctomycetota bacterium]